MSTLVQAESCDSSFCLLPSAAQDSQGQIWLFWENFDSSDIYHKTYNPALQTWSNDQRLTTDPHFDIEPEVISLNNASLMVFWSAKRGGTGNRDFDIYSVRSKDTLNSNVATVTITVTAVSNTPTANNNPFSTEEDTALTALTVNNAPVALDDAYSVAKDTPLFVDAPGVLANDWDPEGDALSAVLVSGPSSGTVLLSSDGSFTYLPAPNFSGQVTFTYQASETRTWSAESPVIRDTSGPIYVDMNPSAVQTKSGDIWLVWDRNVTAANTDLFYSVYNGLSWSAQRKLTNSTGASTGDDREPYMAQTKDGRIWVTWTAVRNGIDEIHYMTFDGVAWSLEGCVVGSGPGCPVSGSPNGDFSPAIAQDRNGTIWAVFSRDITVQNKVVSDLYYVTSTNNGVSWLPAAPLTTTSNGDELNPGIYQFKSGNQWTLWVFYAYFESRLELRYITSSTILAHDMRMDEFNAQPTSVRSGETMTLRADVTNLGDFDETVQLSVIDQYGNPVGSMSGPVSTGSVGQLILNWDTTGVSPGTYTLTATISVAGEGAGNTVDNKASISVLIRPRGDINGDCAVNIDDLARVGRAFGAVMGPPPSANWDPSADVNHDGVINIDDLAAVGGSFGQTC